MNAPFSASLTEQLAMRKPVTLEHYYTLSPFVWMSSRRYEMLLRVVNPAADPSKKVARIYHATSDDGMNFQMSEQASIAPGPWEDDRDGCEDPTLAIVNDTLHVYYTGWNQRKKKGELLYANGPDAGHLAKIGVALPSQCSFQNPKEATVVWGDDGVWNLFFEYAMDGASQIGLAKSSTVAGPWTTVKAKVIEQRAGCWDDWHLSPGPIYQIGDRSYMFYNGANRDPKWRIGWVAFDVRFETIVERCDQPLISPSQSKGDETDIAFSASLVPCGSDLWLYYTVADQYLYRATVTKV